MHNSNHDSFASALSRFVGIHGSPHRWPAECGIIIGVGDSLSAAHSSLLALRDVGCELPVEIWYSGRAAHLDGAMQAAIECLGATACDPSKQSPHVDQRDLKPFSIAWSSFDKVLYLPPGTVCASDPTALFSDSQFADLGAVFWSGPPPGDGWEWAPEIDLQNHPRAPGDRLGPVLLNKRRFWPNLGGNQAFDPAWHESRAKYRTSPIAIA